MAVAEAIGAAIPLIKLNGEIPAAVMVMLNEGPANHIRDAAYKYVRRLDKVRVFKLNPKPQTLNPKPYKYVRRLDKVNFVPRHNFLPR